MRFKIAFAAWPQLLLAGYIVFGAGCQSARNAVYCIGEDLTDIVVAEATLSLGTDMGAHVMATELLQAKAYSYEDLYRVGFGPRRLGIWECEREGWHLSLAHSSRYSWSQDEVVAFAPLSAVSGKLRSRSGAKAMSTESVDEFGVGAHLFVIGGRIGFRPLEVIDLFANLLTLDPLHDNLDWWQRQSMRAAKKAAKNAAKEPNSKNEPSEAVDDPPEDNIDGVSAEEMQQQMDQMQEEMDLLRQSIEDWSYMKEPGS